MKKNYHKKIVAFLIVIFAFIITPVAISYVYADVPEGNDVPCGCCGQTIPPQSCCAVCNGSCSICGACVHFNCQHETPPASPLPPGPGKCSDHGNPQTPTGKGDDTDDTDPEPKRTRRTPGITLLSFGEPLKSGEVDWSESQSYSYGNSKRKSSGASGGNKVSSFNPPKVSLPVSMQPATEEASWKVSPATRNLRVEVTPLHYEPPYGPSVHLTYIYVRERASENKWSCNYDSHMTHGVDLDAGFPIHYVGRYGYEDLQLQITRPNGHTVQYNFDYEENTIIEQKTNPHGGNQNRSSQNPDRLFITEDYVFILKKDNSYEKYDRYSGKLIAIGDKQGHTVKLLRENYGYNSLSAIIDAAGGTTSIERISDVVIFTDPAGKKAEVEYYNNQLKRIISTSGMTNEFNYESKYHGEDVLSQLKIKNKTYTFISTNSWPLKEVWPTSTQGNTHTLNNIHVYEWESLSITSDFGYSCFYEWTTNTVTPEFYSITNQGVSTRYNPFEDIYEAYYYTNPQSLNNYIDTQCVRTDTDASGVRKVRYYINERDVHAIDNWIDNSWKPSERYYFEKKKNNTKGQKKKIVKIMPDGSERIEKLDYNDEGLLISSSVNSSYDIFPFMNNNNTIYTQQNFQTVYSCEYTPMGEIIKETDPIGSVYYYRTNYFIVDFDDKTNSYQLLKAFCGKQGNVTFFDYDEKGRIIKETEYANHVADIVAETILYNTNNGMYISEFRIKNPPAISAYSYQKYSFIVSPNQQKDRITTYTYDTETGYLETMTAPDAVVTYFNYDKSGKLLEEYVAGNGGYSSVATFDKAGRVVSENDTRAGFSIQNLYDSFGLASITNAENTAFDYSFDYAGREISVANPYGVTKTYSYPDNSGSPALWEADVYGTTTFSYARDSVPAKIVFPDGTEINNVYDSQFQLKETINQLGGITSFKYSDFGRTTSVSNHVTGVTASITKDLAGRIVSSSVSDGSSASFSYIADKLVLKTASDAGTINFAYNNFGELKYTRNQQNYIVSNEYDNTGFLIETADSLGRTVSKTKYGSSSLPASVTDARGETTTFGYDDALNNTTITTPDEITTTKSHDLMGRITSVVHGTSAAFTEYDDIGRVTSVSKKSTSDKFIKVETEYFKAQPKPIKTRSFYEQSSNRNQRETSFAYDNCGRVKRVQDAANNVVETAYNGLGLVTNIVAPNQHFASFEFDNSGRLIFEKDFHGRESTISYNANERKTTVTRPDSTTVKTLKDTQGRIRSVVSSGDDEISRTRNFTYRNDGKLNSYSVNFSGDSDSGTCNRNSAGELNSKSGFYNNNIQYNVSYSRNEGGLVNSVNFSSWTGGVNDNGTPRTYTRDEMGRISRVQAGDVDISYTYNNDGRISLIQYPGLYNKSFTYDNSGRLTQSDYRGEYPYLPGSVTINNQYDPYAAARMKQQQLSFNGTPTRVHNYGYDIIDQVTEETLVIGNQFGYNNSVSYLYNGFGDRTSIVANVTNISNVATIEYPNANTIKKITGSLTKAFISDDRGNLIQINEQRVPTLIFEYDSDNNMIGAEVNGTNWTFRYNANNQLYYSKIVNEYDSVIDERFYIYDGLDCIAETDTDGTILREYIRIGNVGGIVAEIRHNDTTCASGYQSGTYYYHYNHRGDVIAVSSHNGGIVFKADYDAYGKITRIDSGSFEPRYTFSTKRYFKDLGLYYYGYRWYLPELGRWTTKDPISYSSGALNYYNFCKNIPITKIDLYGLCEGTHIILVGRNIKNPDFFTEKADHLASQIDGNVEIFQVRDIDDIQNALDTSNINGITYIGHAGINVLFLSITDNNLSSVAVSQLNTDNVLSGAKITLIGCKTAASYNGQSMTSAFANHFKREATGYSGGQSWGFSYPANSDNPWFTLFPNYPRGSSTASSKPKYR